MVVVVGGIASHLSLAQKKPARKKYFQKKAKKIHPRKLGQNKLILFCLPDLNGFTFAILRVFMLPIVPFIMHVKIDLGFDDSVYFIAPALVTSHDNHFVGILLAQFFNKFFDCHNFLPV